MIDAKQLNRDQAIRQPRQPKNSMSPISQIAFYSLTTLVISLTSCQKTPEMPQSTTVQQEVFGKMSDGQPVHQFILRNNNGITARVMEYGAILISLKAPDANGEIADLTHGFDTLDEWINLNDAYFGASVGRYGNRIAHGEFTLDGTSYELATNNEPGGIPSHLHGGIKGFNQALWKGRIIDDQSVAFDYTSVAGEEGFPGTLKTTITYSLNDDNELKWEATATTDAATVVNLVHHTYWNLSGNPTQTILDHELTLHAPSYLPTDKGLIPTGEIATVAGTPMDFTTAHTIGARIDDDFEALQLGAGYDHCWVLKESDGIRLAAQLDDPASGRRMEIFTDQPGIQVYTGNFLDGSVKGKDGSSYPRRSAICLETQKFPDSPNQPDFPPCVLRPNETYKHVLIHKFSTH